MRKNRALLVAGLLFGLIALLHLLRFLFKTQIIIGSHIISLEVSLAAFVITGLLAIWMFMARSDRN